MDQLSQILSFLGFSTLAGLIGTGGMTVFLHIVTQAGITNARMVVAIGSLFTKSLDSALLVGAILHTISGIVFAMLYTLVFIAGGPKSGGLIIGIGLGLGFLHGLVTSICLMVAIAEEHPLEEFRHAGYSVALAHFVGHIIYGVLVGVVIALSGIAAAPTY